MRSKSLLISLVIGFLYAFYLCILLFKALVRIQGKLDVIELQYMSMWLRPHLILTVLAVIFNALGYLQSMKEYALIAAILYSVAAVVNVFYALMILLPIIFSFHGYYQLCRQKEVWFPSSKL